MSPTSSGSGCVRTALLLAGVGLGLSLVFALSTVVGGLGWMVWEEVQADRLELPAAPPTEVGIEAVPDDEPSIAVARSGEDTDPGADDDRDPEPDALEDTGAGGTAQPVSEPTAAPEPAPEPAPTRDATSEPAPAPAAGATPDPAPQPTPRTAPSPRSAPPPSPRPEPTRTEPAPPPDPASDPVTTAPAPAPAPEPTAEPAPDDGGLVVRMGRRDQPTPAPEPAPATDTMVHVGGTATVVLLRDGERHEVPGRVPPGTYQFEAAYSEGDPFRAGTLTAEAGVDMKVLCSQVLDGCRIREY